MQEKEKAQIQEIIAMNRKRSTRIATMESEEDEKARIAAEKAAESSKLSRASRHKIIANLNGGDDSNSETGSSKGAAAAQETREDRLRKREEEKKAREAAVEAAQLEEVRRLEREAAIEANGGVVPPGMETPEELETMRLEKEKEERRAAREEAKEVKEAEKRAQTKAAKEARASGKAVEVHEVDEEPPWYLDCEICKDAGWNMVSRLLGRDLLVDAELTSFNSQDDGRDLLSCDKCEEWQHLQCHVQAHAVPGRPPVDFSAEDFSFVCARCRVNPNRPRRIPPPNLPPPQAYVPSAPPPPAKKGRPKKAPPPPPTPAPPRPSPAERKQQRQNVRCRGFVVPDILLICLPIMYSPLRLFEQQPRMAPLQRRPLPPPPPPLPLPSPVLVNLLSPTTLSKLSFNPSLCSSTNSPLNTSSTLASFSGFPSPTLLRLHPLLRRSLHRQPRHQRLQHRLLHSTRHLRLKRLRQRTRSLPAPPSQRRACHQIPTPLLRELHLQTGHLQQYHRLSATGARERRRQI